MDRLYLPTINIHKKVKKFHIIFIVILKSKDYNLWKQLRKGDYNDERLWTFFEKYFSNAAFSGIAYVWRQIPIKSVKSF